MGFFAFAVERSYVAEHDGLSYTYYFLTQTFFLGGTSPKFPSYHSETLYRKLGITSPHSLHPLPPS